MTHIQSHLRLIYISRHRNEQLELKTNGYLFKSTYDRFEKQILEPIEVKYALC